MSIICFTDIYQSMGRRYDKGDRPDGALETCNDDDPSVLQSRFNELSEYPENPERGSTETRLS